MAEEESTTEQVPEGASPLISADVGGAELRPGDQVGRYVIRERLGEGGFAIVYAAEQTEPVRRQVALKIIKLGMDTRQMIARFEAERQALAMMDHPNVAKVFDAGATETGRPYFVMEYVPGVSITEHCDRQRLGIAERLDLFMQTCEAVQHAHQKGIIHRDLKPSNVLVLIEDGKAIPKVIDFGVAKAISHRLTEKTIYTEQGQLIGTPEYMSPEQAEMTAQDIDTRSDIYSMGVLLYELLTGALPFDPKTLRRAGFGEIQRIIREEEPARPSTRLSSLGDESTMSAQKRQVDPRTLVRELRGDLDWIVMKALEKDRGRRYETAHALTLDIRRHLDHEPVLAGPPGAGYRLSKFVRRNRTAVAAAVVVAVSLLAAAGVSLGFALSEAEQRRGAATERDIAQAVNEFLNEDLLAAVAPSAAAGKGRDVLMHDVLDEAAKRIEEASAPGGRFEEKPLVEASIRETLGETFRKLGEYPAAEPHLERARMLRQRGLGAEHPVTLRSMIGLGLLYLKQGRYEEAEPLYAKALELRRRVLGAEHPDTLDSMNELAILYRSQGRFEEAEPLYVETLELRRRVLGAEHPHTLDSMNNLALLYKKQGRYEEAEPLYVETLELRRRVLGAEHMHTLDSMNNLAVLYRSQGRYEEAEPLYAKALELPRRILGAEHPRTLVSMNNLANLYWSQGRYEEAEPLYAKALEVGQRVLGAEHPLTLSSMNNLAGLYAIQGRYEDAEPICTTAVELQRRVLGTEHPNTLRSMGNLAVLYKDQGRYEDAEPLSLETLEIKRRVLGEEHPATLRSVHNLAALYGAQGRYEKAEPLFLQALETRVRVLGEAHPETLSSVKDLAELYDAWGKPEKAAEWRAKLAEELNDQED